MRISPGDEYQNLIEKCIQDCKECHSICTAIISHCLKMGREHANERHISILQDCADICKLSEDGMLRSSEMMERICRLCGDICTTCADSCESFTDDNFMEKCAEVCRICADSCRQMSKSSDSYGTRLTSFS
ncbi:MAG: four-helix bundle copper-binding protein [Euryarchaeota archaeon]|nr:four-helix bundle copper-binding protein [Euryarchaeota archaeon]